MTKFQNRIISASAGTGKTYRLSLEYISLILQYYQQHPDFSLDAVLALTFTRKATSEIRERIMSQLQELLKNPQGELAQDLRKYVAGDSQGLSVKEQNILLSAFLEISADQRNLQVMTIDSFTSSIFRNIVRPLRSIDDYELDTDAVAKRLPYLMNHLMSPEFRDRVDKILVRKVRRSLDDYAEFFRSMIDNRWIYYLIRQRCPQNQYASLPAQHDFEQAFNDFGEGLQQICVARDKAEFAKYFKKDFSQLLPDEISEPAGLKTMVQALLKRSSDAMSLFKVICSKGMYKKNLIPKTARDYLGALQDEVLLALAEKLYHEYFIPEQDEILQLWETILLEYDRLIYRYKNMTYQDIAWFTFEALFSPEPPTFDLSDETAVTEFYEFLSHRTRFMLIDEFQDTSLIQFNTLRPIMEEICSGYGSKEIGGIVVVGDEKQSIFGWRGGERDLLLFLKHIIPSLQEVEIEALTSSWRAGDDMMDFINKIFTDAALQAHLSQHNMQWSYPEVKSAVGKISTTIELKCLGHSRRDGGVSDSYRFFIEKMVLPALKNQKEESIAILCRKGKQLEELQLLLEEHQQTGVFQPSASIITHHLVSALLHWLRFVCYRDWLDFLAFLRSDFLLLKSEILKQLLDRIAEYEHCKKEGSTNCSLALDDLSPIDELLALAQTHAQQGPYSALREIINLVAIKPDLFPERDYLNLQAFLNLAHDWELNQAQAGIGIPDFLEYVQANAKQDAFTQVSVEEDTGMQLLTIHKSKGLQFDRVFIYYDLSRNRSSDKNLYWAIQYLDESFHDISGYALSYHYQDILKYSPAAKLWQEKEKGLLLEELNTLYVAFTRAKQHLHICFSYEGSQDWPEYHAKKQNEEALSLPMILANACMCYFQNTTPNADGIYIQQNHYTPKDEEKTKESDSATVTPEPRLCDYAALNWENVLALEQIPGLDYKTVYLEKRQALWGDIVHYYLSFIYYDSPDEHAQAKRQCINRYGSLVPLSKLKRIFERLTTELRRHSFLFAEKYDKIFNEFEIAHFRIDRLMLNTATKEAVIVDYKTGAISEKEQLDSYARALSALPAFVGFSLEKLYLQLDLF